MKNTFFSTFILIFSAFLTGLILRVYEFSNQIIADDEFHALYVAIRNSYTYISTHFGVTDHSIPLALMYKLWMEVLPLNEFVLRAPMLLSGIATILVFPFLLRAHLNKESIHAYRWLLAISPLCIYFSRYARPYAITMLLAFTALVAFYEWARKGQHSMLFLYLSCGIFAPYFHLASAPMVLAPPCYWILRTVLSKKNTKEIKHYIKALLTVLSGHALFMGAPLILSEDVFMKLDRGSVDSMTLKGTIELLSGTGSIWITIPVLTLIILEASRLWLYKSVWIQYLTFAVFIQIGTVLFFQPQMVHVPIVFTRYIIVILPILLLILASGLGRIENGLATNLSRYPKGIITLSVTAILFYSGPLLKSYYHPNNWTNHAIFQYSYDPLHPYAVNNLIKPQLIPEFYKTLRKKKPGSLTLLEAPWYYQWGINNQPYYQQVHRQNTIIGFVDSSNPPKRLGELPLDDTRLNFRNFIYLGDLRKLQDSSVDFVVFHKNLKREVDDVPVLEHLENPNISIWLEQYNQWFGDPIYEDRTIVVYSI